MMTTKEKVLEGPFAKSRLRLLAFADLHQLKNETLLIPLAANWSGTPKDRAAYVLGVIWGRLRQMNSALEHDTEYANTLNEELKDD